MPDFTRRRWSILGWTRRLIHKRLSKLAFFENLERTERRKFILYLVVAVVLLSKGVTIFIDIVLASVV